MSAKFTVDETTIVNSSNSIDALYNRLYQDGYMVSLSIGKKSWTTRLTPEMMGVKEFPANWKPGRCLLLPEDQLSRIDQIEGAARRFLQKKASMFIGDSESRSRVPFVKFTNMPDVRVQLEKYRMEYFEAVDKLIADYETLKDKQATDFPEQWPKMKDHYVDAAQIRKHYYFRYKPFKFTMPQSVESGELDPAEEAAFIASHAKLLKENKEAAETFKRIHESALIEQRKAAKDELMSSVREAARSFRGGVVDAFSSFLKAREEGKAILPKSINALRKTIEWVKEANPFDDKDLTTRLNDIQKQLDSGTKFSEDQEAVTALSEVLKQTIDFVRSTTDSQVEKMTSDYFTRSLDI